MDQRDEAGWLVMLRYILLRAAAAGIGVGAYFGLARIITIDQQDQIAPAFYAVAGVVGVVAGFLGAALIFIAGASGPSIDRLRRDHGKDLNRALLTAMTVLIFAAFGSVLCGLFYNGVGAKAAMCGILAMVGLDAGLVGSALAVALKSGLEEPLPAAESYVPPDDDTT